MSDYVVDGDIELCSKSQNKAAQVFNRYLSTFRSCPFALLCCKYKNNKTCSCPFLRVASHRNIGPGVINRKYSLMGQGVSLRV